MAEDEAPAEPLDGGWETDVWRVGNEVRRSPEAWSSSVHALLRHLESVGFTAAPRPIGNGFDDDGNERLSFVDGTSIHPAPWSSDGLHQVGGMLRSLHDAAASFEPGADAQWRSWFGRSLGDSGAGFGHGDLGPWNIMAIGGEPSGFIDWDFAGPLDPAWEVAQAAWLNVQLYDDDVAAKVGLGDARERSARLAIFLDGYGLSPAGRHDFVDKMIEVAVRSAAAEAIDHAVSPETTSGITSAGYPFAWGMAWRIRSARWMVEHRKVLETSFF